MTTARVTAVGLAGIVLLIVGHALYRHEERAEAIAKIKVTSDATGKGLTEEQIEKMLDSLQK